jgi:hypothetical protein
MADDHIGIYVCLIVLIIICGGILAVLLYNSDIELPKADPAKLNFTDQQKQMIYSLGENTAMAGQIVLVGLGIAVVMGLLSALVVFRHQERIE